MEIGISSFIAEDKTVESAVSMPPDKTTGIISGFVLSTLGTSALPLNTGTVTTGVVNAISGCFPDIPLI